MLLLISFIAISPLGFAFNFSSEINEPISCSQEIPRAWFCGCPETFTQLEKDGWTTHWKQVSTSCRVMTDSAEFYCTGSCTYASTKLTKKDITVHLPRGYSFKELDCV